MNSLHGKLSMSQCARFIENDSPHLGKCIHIVAALDKNAIAGSAANASEESKGNADDQGTRTRHH